jgi:hypothetical protein
MLRVRERVAHPHVKDAGYRAIFWQSQWDLAPEKLREPQRSYIKDRLEQARLDAGAD